MKRKLLRVGIVVGILVVIILMTTIPADASIGTNPTQISVNWVYVYENALQTGDMLFWADYTVSYASVPTQPINQTYLLRLVNASTSADIRDSAPYPYFQLGYDEGLCVIYFNATDAESLTWGSSGYNMRLDGNPGATWTGGGSIPSASPVPSSSFTWKSSSSVAENQAIITPDLLAEGLNLQNIWGSSLYVLVTTVPSGTYLYTQGITYFSNVLPNLNALAPKALASSSAPLTVITTTPPATPYSATISSDFSGSPFDLTNAAAAMHIPVTWFGIALVLAIDLFVVVEASKQVNSYKPIILLSLPLLYVFTRIGWLPMLVTIALGVMSVFAIWYTFFWEKSIS